MTPAFVNEATPVPPPAYHRAQARFGPALHIDALTLVNPLESETPEKPLLFASHLDEGRIGQTQWH